MSVRASASEPYRVTSNQFSEDSLPSQGQVLRQYYFIRHTLVPEYGGKVTKVPVPVIVSTLLSQLKAIWIENGVSPMADESIKKRLQRLVAPPKRGSPKGGKKTKRRSLDNNRKLANSKKVKAGDGRVQSDSSLFDISQCSCHKQVPIAKLDGVVCKCKPKPLHFDRDFYLASLKSR